MFNGDGDFVAVATPPFLVIAPTSAGMDGEVVVALVEVKEGVAQALAQVGGGKRLVRTTWLGGKANFVDAIAAQGLGSFPAEHDAIAHFGGLQPQGGAIGQGILPFNRHRVDIDPD